VVGILEFMDPDRVVDMAVVFPVPYLKIVEKVAGRNQNPEGSPYIFNCFVLIYVLFKTQFLQLGIVYRNGIEVPGFIPVLLVAVMDANLFVFMVEFRYFRIESLSAKIRLKEVSYLDILKSDHMAIILRI
jgi:hypothetical protein